MGGEGKWGNGGVNLLLLLLFGGLGHGIFAVPVLCMSFPSNFWSIWALSLVPPQVAKKNHFLNKTLTKSHVFRASE